MQSTTFPVATASAADVRDIGIGLEAEQYMLTTIRAARGACGRLCPRCRSARIIRWGSFLAPERTRQRYRCRDCRRTFSDLTALPMAYSKRLSRWHRYLRGMNEHWSLRRSATVTRVHASTALRWRHRILNALRAADNEPLGGWIELWRDWYSEAQPGRYSAPEERRVRGQRRFAPNADSYQIIFAVARDGGFNAFVLNIPLCRSPLERLFATRFLPGATLLYQERPGDTFARTAQRAGLRYFVAGSRSRPAPCELLLHTAAAEAYRRHFNLWLHRFRGIATYNLPRYITWHRNNAEAPASLWLERCLRSWCSTP